MIILGFTFFHVFFKTHLFHAMIAVYTIELLFFVITTVVYVTVLSILWQGWISSTSKLSGPFFKMCFVTGICDICKPNI